MSRLVYGINPVSEVLKNSPDSVKEIAYTEGTGGLKGKILLTADSLGIITRRLEAKQLDRLASTTKHQGIIATLPDFRYSSLDDIISYWKESGKKAFILLLDGIQDPQNLGSIIRSAECAGIHGIIIPKDRAAEVTPAVEKVSAGASGLVRIVKAVNIARTIDSLKDCGLWIFGAEGGADMSLFSADFSTDTAIVIGSEGKGIRPLVKKKCDFLLSIPLKGSINSLNASVSSALVMYEVVRQRQINQ